MDILCNINIFILYMTGYHSQFGLLQSHLLLKSKSFTISLCLKFTISSLVLWKLYQLWILRGLLHYKFMMGKFSLSYILGQVNNITIYVNNTNRQSLRTYDLLCNQVYSTRHEISTNQIDINIINHTWYIW